MPTRERCRRGLWVVSWVQHGSWFARFWVVSRFLGGLRQGPEHNSERAPCRADSATLTFLRLRGPPQHPPDPCTEDNKAVVAVLNAKVVASTAMMSDLRKLRLLLHLMGVDLEARRIPTTVKRFADRLSRIWNPADVEATEEHIGSIRRQHSIEEVSFMSRPLNTPYQVRRKYLQDEMHTSWGDGFPAVRSSIRPSYLGGTEDPGRRAKGF